MKLKKLTPTNSKRAVRSHILVWVIGMLAFILFFIADYFFKFLQ